MKYRLTQTLSGRGTAPHQFASALRGLALDGDGHLYAAGDSEIKVFDPDGSLLERWPTGRPAWAVAVDGEGHRSADRVWVGEEGQVEIFDRAGELADTWSDPGLGLVTAVGFTGGDVFLADASARWIHRYDRSGNLLNHIGDHHRKGGFHIPNGTVDFAVDGEGVLHVANPGMHRVERYAPSGELLGRFGRFDGVDPEGFPGCCNPTNVTVAGSSEAGDGRVIVSEKAGPRVKVYDLEGHLLSVVAEGRDFDPGAKNMDLVVDGEGRIYVADTGRFRISVFSPVAETAPAGEVGA
jgi:sugar lactone lactonase YvrE